MKGTGREGKERKRKAREEKGRQGEGPGKIERGIELKLGQ